MILPLVVLGGVVTMVLEMAAARLLSPYFGTSLYIWGLLIGLVLAYLSVGYWLGGKLADRRPRRTLFYALNAAAAVAVAIVAAIASPVLSATLHGTAGLPFGLFAGAIASILILFALPLVLLLILGPFAIRLRMEQVAGAGHVAGTIFALTTAGSLVGTFGAVFVAIPWAGTRAALYLAAGVLLASAGVATLVDRSVAGRLAQ